MFVGDEVEAFEQVAVDEHVVAEARAQVVRRADERFQSASGYAGHVPHTVAPPCVGLILLRASCPSGAAQGIYLSSFAASFSHAFSKPQRYIFLAFRAQSETTIAFHLRTIGFFLYFCACKNGQEPNFIEY